MCIETELCSLVTMRCACYVEFAELNTELGDAADLTQGSGATPFFSFHKFVMNVMFPGQPDHPVMHPVRVCTQHPLVPVPFPLSPLDPARYRQHRIPSCPRALRSAVA